MIVRRSPVCSLLLLALISAGPLGAVLSDRAPAIPGSPPASAVAMTAKVSGTRLCPRALAASLGCIVDKTIVQTADLPRSDRIGGKPEATDSRIPAGLASAPILRPPRPA